jgi:hypothetical protein
MAGYDTSEASRPLLTDFGLQIGEEFVGAGADVPEPQPMGHHKVPYLDTGKYRAHVRFHAAWPVAINEPDPKRREKSVIANGWRDQPVIRMVEIGKGKVVVVGDTGFAMNKNLEHEGGQPFVGMRENADFWRWLLSRLLSTPRNQPMWIPQEPASAPAGDQPPATAPAEEAEP